MVYIILLLYAGRGESCLGELLAFGADHVDKKWPGESLVAPVLRILKSG
jgi:hypothetical protein